MTLPIDFGELRLLILIIFAFVGIMRGWYREGITTLFVALLGILVWQPEVADQIINWVNNIIKLLIMLFRSGFSFDPATISAQTVSPDELLDPSSYRLWTIITVFLVFASYAVGTRTPNRPLTGLGHLLGGILGLVNGYMLLALARKYLTDYWEAQGQIVTQGAPVTIQMTNVPTGSLVGGVGVIFVLGILVAVVALLIFMDLRKGPIL
jgi:hypothetical protein